MATIESERTPASEQRVYRLTVDAYHRMIDAGVFGKDDRVDLVEGELRAMRPISARHAGKVKRLNQLFSRLAAGRVLIAIQDPLALPDYSDPAARQDPVGSSPPSARSENPAACPVVLMAA